MNSLQAVLARIARDLDQIGVRWALVGALALSIRASVRNTIDVDVVAGLETDSEAEWCVQQLFRRGYRQHSVLEMKPGPRLKGVRFFSPVSPDESGIVDVLFSMTGIEREIVGSAEVLEVLPGLNVPVVTSVHLAAMKVLAWRDQDLVDLRSLMTELNPTEMQQVSKALDLIHQRGFGGDRNLQARWEYLLAQESENGS